MPYTPNYYYITGYYHNEARLSNLFLCLSSWWYAQPYKTSIA